MIRTEVRRKLSNLVAGSGLTGPANVSPFFPGEKHQTAEMIFGDRTSGSVGFPYGMTGTRIQRDQFTVTFVVRIAARTGIEDAMTRCEELANVVAAILADTDALIGYSVNGEEVTDTNPDAQGVQVETREGESKTGDPLALAEITVPIETQTLNTEG